MLSTTPENTPRWTQNPAVRAACRIGFEPQNISHLIEQINPMWSLTRLKAKVIDIIDETHDCKSFVLAPNAHWQGIRAGQHIGVSVEIDGISHSRCYSLSCAESNKAQSENNIRITVKRVSDGLVSNYLHEHVGIGDIIDIAPANGDFVLPSTLPNSVLVLTAGSGVTPVFSQVSTLLQNGYTGDINFVHYVQSFDDRILSRDLEQLAKDHDNFSVSWCLERGAKTQKPQRFSAEQISELVPDYKNRTTLLCGPSGFMEAVCQHWESIDRSELLSLEYFGTPPVNNEEAVDADITLKSGRTIQLSAGQTLLDSLLAHQEPTKYGCKRGVCHECKCRKTEGAVKNLLTGNITSGEEDIQLCISAPVSDIKLA